jgi:hypothetical protein
MESKDAEQLMGMLQALTLAVSALLKTHPAPDELRPAFETLVAKAPHPHPLFSETVATLRKAIP